MFYDHFSARSLLAVRLPDVEIEAVGQHVPVVVRLQPLLMILMPM